MKRILFTYLFVLSAIGLGSGCAERQYVEPRDLTVQEQDLSCAARFGSGHCVVMRWERQPTEEEPGSFLFKVFPRRDWDGTPMAEDLPGEMTVLLWMPSMNHGSVPVNVERLGPGSYRATNVYFIMKGDWEIRFLSKESDQVRDQASIRLLI